MASAMENISNIKLYDLITRWIEVQKMRPDYNDGNPLNIDVMDLTLLLKSMGLKLEYIDFQDKKNNTDTLSVQITCNKSGVLAKLNYDLLNCSCPDRNHKETSFWEVQGTGPSVFSKCTNDTSSNLLPEISEKCSMVSKAMLSNLLDYYRSNIKAIERGEDVLQSPLKVAVPKICVITPGKSLVSDPCATPPAEGRTIEAPPTPDNRHKFESVSDGIKPRSLDELQDSPKKPSEEQNDIKSNTSSGSVGIDNATRELSDNDPTGKPVIVTPEPRLSGVETPSDSSFANSEAMKALITSSPNDKLFDSMMNIEQNHERDLNVIHCLQEARQQIDTALLVMRLNNPCSDLKKASAVITTPQTVIRNKHLDSKQLERNPVVARRMSLPGRPSDSPKITASSSPALAMKKKTTIPSHLSRFTSTAQRGDTPRPTVSQVKTVSMLRKTSSSSSVASTSSTTTKSSSSAITRKPIAGIKPVGSVRPATSTAGKTAASVSKSSSASKLDKK